MKFPISRDDLQNFDIAKDRAEQAEEQMKQSVAYILGRLCSDFKRDIAHNFHNKKFIWRNIDSERMTGVTEQLLPHLITKLEETFLNCQILVDPLKTYLVIDWS
jgi:argonaute-like protein implicated in RNA metabolism and viral defense